MSLSTNVKFNNPVDISVDNHGYIFIADNGNNSLRLISPSGRIVGKIFDTIQTKSVVVDNERNIYFLHGNNTVRKIGYDVFVRFLKNENISYNDTQNVDIINLGNKNIYKLCVNHYDNDLYLSSDNLFLSYNKDNIFDQNQFNTIIDQNTVTNITNMCFSYKSDEKYTLYFIYNSKVYKTQKVSSYNETIDNYLVSDVLQDPKTIVVDRNDNVYLYDNYTKKIYKNNVAIIGSGNTELIDGTGTNAGFVDVKSMTLDNNENIYIVDSNSVRKITKQDNNYTISTIFGSLDSGNKDTDYNRQEFLAEYLYIKSQNRFLSGLRGDVGNTGSEGPVGFDGIKGNTGIRGITGSQGSQGIQGIQGPMGPKGKNGLDGPIGPTGENADPNNGISLISKIDIDYQMNGYYDKSCFFTGEKVFLDTYDNTQKHVLTIDTQIPLDNPTECFFIKRYNTDTLYVCDTAKNCVKTIRKSTNGSNDVDIVIGKEGKSGFMPSEIIGNPSGITITPNNKIFLCDETNNVIYDGDYMTIFAGQAYCDLIDYKNSSIENTIYIKNPLNDPSYIKLYKDGIGTNARFNKPKGITSDQYNNLYVCDSGNNCIRKITPNKEVTTIVSNLKNPSSIFHYKGILYVSDTDNNSIKRIRLSNNSIITIGDSNGKSGYKDGNYDSCLFNSPRGIVVDLYGNVYVCDEKNNIIRKIIYYSQTNIQVSTVCGSLNKGDSNVIGDVRLNNPYGISIDLQNDILYICDTGNKKIKTISSDDLILHCGSDILLKNNSITRMTTDVIGGTLYFLDTYNNNFESINLYDNHVERIAGKSSPGYSGNNGGAINALLNNPQGVTIVSHYDEEYKTMVFDDIYIADTENFCIRRINYSTNNIYLYMDFVTEKPTRICYDRIKSNNFFVAFKDSNKIIKFNIETKSPQTILNVTKPSEIKLDKTCDNLYYTYNDNKILYKYNTTTNATSTVCSGFNCITGIDINPTNKNNYVYVADTDKVYLIDIDNSSNKTLLGDGFVNITGITVSTNGKILYVCDNGNNKICKLKLVHAFPVENLVKTKIAGSDGSNILTVNNFYKDLFSNSINECCMDNEDNIYATTKNNCIIKINGQKDYFLLAGKYDGNVGINLKDGIGQDARFYNPTAICLDSAENPTFLYIVDSNNHAIRSLDLRNMYVKTLSGVGVPGLRNGFGTMAQFSNPTGIIFSTNKITIFPSMTMDQERVRQERLAKLDQYIGKIFLDGVIELKQKNFQKLFKIITIYPEVLNDTGIRTDWLIALRTNKSRSTTQFNLYNSSRINNVNNTDQEKRQIIRDRNMYIFKEGCKSVNIDIDTVYDEIYPKLIKSIPDFEQKINDLSDEQKTKIDNVISKTCLFDSLLNDILNVEPTLNTFVKSASHSAKDSVVSYCSKIYNLSKNLYDINANIGNISNAQDFLNFAIGNISNAYMLYDMYNNPIQFYQMGVAIGLAAAGAVLSKFGVKVPTMNELSDLLEEYLGDGTGNLDSGIELGTGINPYLIITDTGNNRLRIYSILLNTTWDFGFVPHPSNRRVMYYDRTCKGMPKKPDPLANMLKEIGEVVVESGKAVYRGVSSGNWSFDQSKLTEAITDFYEKCSKVAITLFQQQDLKYLFKELLKNGKIEIIGGKSDIDNSKSPATDLIFTAIDTYDSNDTSASNTGQAIKNALNGEPKDLVITMVRKKIREAYSDKIKEAINKSFKKKTGFDGDIFNNNPLSTTFLNVDLLCQDPKAYFKQYTNLARHMREGKWWLVAKDLIPLNFEGYYNNWKNLDYDAICKDLFEILAFALAVAGFPMASTLITMAPAILEKLDIVFDRYLKKSEPLYVSAPSNGRQLVDGILNYDDYNSMSLPNRKGFLKSIDERYASIAMINEPAGICLGSYGNIYISDSKNNAIRAIKDDGYVYQKRNFRRVQTISGVGEAGFADSLGPASNQQAKYNCPTKMVYDQNNDLYIIDKNNFMVRKLSLNDGIVMSIAGNGVKGYKNGISEKAQFSDLSSIFVDYNKTRLFVVDDGKIREINKITAEVFDFDKKNITRINNSDIPKTCSLSQPNCIINDSQGNKYISDSGFNVIRKIGIDGKVSIIAGKHPKLPPEYPITGDIQVEFTCGNGNNNSFNINMNYTSGLGYTSADLTISKFDKNNFEVFSEKNFKQGDKLCIFQKDDPTFFQTYTVNYFDPPFYNTLNIKLIPTTKDNNKTYGTAFPMSGVKYIISIIYDSPYFDNTYRRYGNDGKATNATFSYPYGLALDNTETNLYVSDAKANMVRKINLQSGMIYNVISEDLRNPMGLAFLDNNNLLVVDSGNHTIKNINVTTGKITKYYGNGMRGICHTTDESSNGCFNYPSSIAIDIDKDVYVTDSGNNRICKIKTDSNGKRYGCCIGFAFDKNKYNNNSSLTSKDQNDSTTVYDLKTVVPTGTAFSDYYKFNDLYNSIRYFDDRTYDNIDFRNFSYATRKSFGEYGITEGPNAYIPEKFENSEYIQDNNVNNMNNSSNIGYCDGFNAPLYVDLESRKKLNVDPDPRILPCSMFNFPVGIAVDSSKNVYISDTRNDTIRKLTKVNIDFSVKVSVLELNFFKQLYKDTDNVWKYKDVQYLNNLTNINERLSEISQLYTTKSIKNLTEDGKSVNIKVRGGVDDFNSVLNSGYFNDLMNDNYLKNYIKHNRANTGDNDYIHFNENETYISSTLYGKFSSNTNIKFSNPTGITLHQNNLYICNSGFNKISKVDLGNTNYFDNIFSNLYYKLDVNHLHYLEYYNQVYSKDIYGISQQYPNTITPKDNMYENNFVDFYASSDNVNDFSVNNISKPEHIKSDKKTNFPVGLHGNNFIRRYKDDVDLPDTWLKDYRYIAYDMAVLTKHNFNTNTFMNNLIINRTQNELDNNIINIGYANSVDETVIGSGSNSFDGIGTVAVFDNPTQIIEDSVSNLYITEEHNNSIRKLNKNTYEVSTISIDKINKPTEISIDSQDNLYVIDNEIKVLYKMDSNGMNMTKILENEKGLPIMNEPAIETENFSTEIKTIKTKKEGDIYFTNYIEGTLTLNAIYSEDTYKRVHNIDPNSFQYIAHPFVYEKKIDIIQQLGDTGISPNVVDMYYAEELNHLYILTDSTPTIKQKIYCFRLPYIKVEFQTLEKTQYELSLLWTLEITNDFKNFIDINRWNDSISKIVPITSMDDAQIILITKKGGFAYMIKNDTYNPSNMNTENFDVTKIQDVSKHLGKNFYADYEKVVKPGLPDNDIKETKKILPLGADYDPYSSENLHNTNGYNQWLSYGYDTYGNTNYNVFKTDISFPEDASLGSRILALDTLFTYGIVTAVYDDYLKITKVFFISWGDQKYFLKRNYHNFTGITKIFEIKGKIVTSIRKQNYKDTNFYLYLCEDGKMSDIVEIKISNGFAMNKITGKNEYLFFDKADYGISEIYENSLKFVKEFKNTSKYLSVDPNYLLVYLVDDNYLYSYDFVNGNLTYIIGRPKIDAPTGLVTYISDNSKLRVSSDGNVYLSIYNTYDKYSVIRQIKYANDGTKKVKDIFKLDNFIIDDFVINYDETYMYVLVDDKVYKIDTDSFGSVTIDLSSFGVIFDTYNTRSLNIDGVDNLYFSDNNNIYMYDQELETLTPIYNNTPLTDMVFTKDYNIYIIKDNFVYKLSPPSNNKTSTITADNSSYLNFGFSEMGQTRTGNYNSARFCNPTGIFATKNKLYVSDTFNNCINEVTFSGESSIFAGSMYNNTKFRDNDSKYRCTFNSPRGLVCNTNGNLFIADSANNRIRVVDTSGVCKTFAGTKKGNKVGTMSKFNNPTDLTIDNTENIYVTDTGNNCIKKITRKGVSSIVAGNDASGTDNGNGTNAKFNAPEGIIFDKNSRNIYVSDTGNNQIRKIDISGNVTTVFKNITFKKPMGLAIDTFGFLYVADSENHVIKKLDMNTEKLISTIGSGQVGYESGTDEEVKFYYPFGITIGQNNILYITERNNNIIRKKTLYTLTEDVDITSITCVKVSPFTGTTYFVNTISNAIYKIVPFYDKIELYKGLNGYNGYNVTNMPSYVTEIVIAGDVLEKYDELYCTDGMNKISKIDRYGNATEIFVSAVLPSNFYSILPYSADDDYPYKTYVNVNNYSSTNYRNDTVEGLEYIRYELGNYYYYKSAQKSWYRDTSNKSSLGKVNQPYKMALINTYDRQNQMLIITEKGKSSFRLVYLNKNIFGRTMDAYIRTIDLVSLYNIKLDIDEILDISTSPQNDLDICYKLNDGSCVIFRHRLASNFGTLVEVNKNGKIYYDIQLTHLTSQPITCFATLNNPEYEVDLSNSQKGLIFNGNVPITLDNTNSYDNYKFLGIKNNYYCWSWMNTGSMTDYNYTQSSSGSEIEDSYSISNGYKYIPDFTCSGYKYIGITKYKNEYYYGIAWNMMTTNYNIDSNNFFSALFAKGVLKNETGQEINQVIMFNLNDSNVSSLPPNKNLTTLVYQFIYQAYKGTLIKNNFGYTVMDLFESKGISLQSRKFGSLDTAMNYYYFIDQTDTRVNSYNIAFVKVSSQFNTFNTPSWYSNTNPYKLLNNKNMSIDPNTVKLYSIKGYTGTFNTSLENSFDIDYDAVTIASSGITGFNVGNKTFWDTDIPAKYIICSKPIDKNYKRFNTNGITMVKSISSSNSGIYVVDDENLVKLIGLDGNVSVYSGNGESKYNNLKMFKNNYLVDGNTLKRLSSYQRNLICSSDNKGDIGNDGYLVLSKNTEPPTYDTEGYRGEIRYSNDKIYIYSGSNWYELPGNITTQQI